MPFYWRWWNQDIPNAAGPAIVNEAATTTNPTLIPNQAELDTGIGWASDTLHFVLGGATKANLSTTALTLIDSVKLALGTGSDSTLYYDGTDTFLNLRAVGTGDLMIALETSPPSPDPNSVHIWGGSAGGVDAPSAFPGLIVENNDHTGITILSTNARQGRLFFGDGDDSQIGFLSYNHSATPNEFSITVGGTNQLIMTDGTFTFQEPMVVHTLGNDNLTMGTPSGTGDLFLQANGNTLIALDGGVAGLGFYGTTPVAQQTSVSVSIAAVHAALVSLGLITA